MSDNLLKSQAFALKGRLCTLTVMQIFDHNIGDIHLQIKETIAKAPKLFAFTPIIIDVTQLAEPDIDLLAICEVLRKNSLIPVAVHATQPLMQKQAQMLGLAIISASAMQDKGMKEHKPKKSELATSKLLTTPLRSGQQMFCKEGDLIVIAAVSHGAELLARDNIHVYGALRGRALAGINGNKQARIFCQSLDAELVSIAGVYRLRESMEPVASPCQIYLQDDRIQIDPL